MRRHRIINVCVVNQLQQILVSHHSLSIGVNGCARTCLACSRQLPGHGTTATFATFHPSRSNMALTASACSRFWAAITRRPSTARTPHNSPITQCPSLYHSNNLPLNVRTLNVHHPDNPTGSPRPLVPAPENPLPAPLTHCE